MYRCVEINLSKIMFQIIAVVLVKYIHIDRILYENEILGTRVILHDKNYIKALSLNISHWNALLHYRHHCLSG